MLQCKDSRSIQVVELALRLLANFCPRCDTLSVAILSNFTAAKSETILIR